MRNWCPLGIIDWEFAYAGCEVRIHRKCMKHHLDEDVKDHLDLMTKKFSAIKIAYEKEQDTSKGLRDELEGVKVELEEVKQELEDVKAQERDWTDEVTLVEQLCYSLVSRDDRFCAAQDQILVSNLPPHATEQMVKSIFSHHGPIQAVKLFTDFSTAVVEFRYSDSVFKMFQKYNSSDIKLLDYQLKCIRFEE